MYTHQRVFLLCRLHRCRGIYPFGDSRFSRMKGAVPEERHRRRQDIRNHLLQAGPGLLLSKVEGLYLQSIGENSEYCPHRTCKDGGARIRQAGYYHLWGIIAPRCGRRGGGALHTGGPHACLRGFFCGPACRVLSRLHSLKGRKDRYRQQYGVPFRRECGTHLRRSRGGFYPAQRKPVAVLGAAGLPAPQRQPPHRKLLHYKHDGDKHGDGHQGV